MNVRAEDGVVVAIVGGGSNHGALVGMGGCGGVESGGNKGQARDEDEAARCNDKGLGSEANLATRKKRQLLSDQWIYWRVFADAG
jgi:hypothetical protein